MTYNFRHKHCQPNVLNLENSTLFISKTTLQSSYPNASKNLSRSFRIGIRLSIKQRLRLKKRTTPVSHTNLPFVASPSKTLLAFIPLLILPYSFNTQALSATTANTIQGTAPYLTFDGGTTKATDMSALLWIKLSDGSTPAPNSSTTPITLPTAGETFADIDMLVPTAAPPVSAADPTQTINLNALIGAPNNYWGDDDGDGLGTSGITATGSLSVVITDKYGTKVNRSDTLDICDAPYKVVLSSTAGSLSTQYGDPSSSAFTASNATYFITPNEPPKVCFAKPDMTYATGQYAGPASMWNTTKGFIPQSTTPATYGSNFPTTGANGLYFDLDIGGAAGPLTWAPVTDKGITATMSSPTSTSVRVTLTGPTTAIPPSPFNTAGATFELEGKSGGTTVVKYGFTIKKWYVNRGTTTATPAATNTWCTGLGYRLPKVQDLTNASGGNYFSRSISNSLFAEWGYMGGYPVSDFVSSGYYWTSEAVGRYQLMVFSNDGTSYFDTFSRPYLGVCTHP